MRVILNSYKEFEAEVIYEKTEKYFYGEVVGLPSNHSLTLEGASIKEIEQDFHEAIDDYLDLLEMAKEYDNIIK